MTLITQPPTHPLHGSGIGSDHQRQITDAGAIEALVDEVLSSNAAQVENYRNADPAKQPKMLGFFVGQIMKKSQGKANPQQLNELLRKKLS